MSIFPRFVIKVRRKHPISLGAMVLVYFFIVAPTAPEECGPSHSSACAMNTTSGGADNPDFPDSRYVVSSNDVAHALALQPDGKIIVAGSSWSPASNSTDFALARYNPDGRLDTSFGVDGKVTTDIGAGDDEARALVLQPDGKIVVVGYWLNKAAELRNFALTRYAADGKLDPSFGTGGKVIATTGSGDDYIHALALQPDGKIVVAGSFSQGSGSNSILFRYNPDGTSDANFGKGGRRLLAQSGVSALIIEASGKIVVAGPSLEEDDSSFTLMRYNSDGSLDATFNAASIVTIPTNTSGETAVAIQPDGKIVVAGASENRFGVRRYNPDGSLDASFGTGGLVTTSIGTDYVFYERATAVALQADGKIVVTGYTLQADDANLEDDSNFVLVRYNADGSLDTSFGTNGTAFTNAGADGVATALVLQGDDKIVVAGSVSKSAGFDQGVYSDFAVARYNPNGTADLGFGSGGMVTTNFYSVSLDPDRCTDAIVPPRSGMLSGGRRLGLLFFSDVATNLDFQPDNKIVAAGSSDRGVALVRYNLDGSLDTAFGQDGKVTNRIGTYDKQSDEALALIRQADGKMVMLGRSWIDPPMYPYGDTSVLLRYMADGTPDASFGTGGTVIIDSTIGEIFTVALQTDGKIIAAGQAAIPSVSASSQPMPQMNGPTISMDSTVGGSRFSCRTLAPPGDGSVGFTLVRYNPDGSLDMQFGTGGKVTTDFGPRDDVAHAVILQRDGKIVVVGSPGQDPDSELVVVRYNPDGTLDAGFGSGGKVVIPFPGGSARIHAMALHEDSKLVIVGSSEQHLVVTRYNPDGTLDIGFGSDGKVITPLDSAPPFHGRAFALDLQSSGRIAVAGAFAGKFVLVHYDAQGHLDSSFGKDGIVPTAIDTSASEVRALAFQEDHKIVVAGSCSNGLGSILALFRYNPDGSLDTSFGQDGKVTTRIGEGSIVG